MSTPGKVDYHIHHYLDSCAHSEMTLPNIEAEAARLGLEEICILKHYSSKLPNGQKEWVNWKQVKPKQFDTFLEEMHSYKPSSGIRILSGAEVELLDCEGEINIDREDAERLDSVSLSVHWMPDLKIIKADPVLVPGNIGKVSEAAAELWSQQIRKLGAAAILEKYVEGYVKAMENNPKVRVLAHMCDGLNTLRSYEIKVDELGEDKLLELMEPLMRACKEYEVLWEISERPVKCEAILKRANELGVKFTATVDAHFLYAEGWSHLKDHYMIEEYISELGLTKGLISL